MLAGLAPGTGGLTPNGETLRTHVRRVPGFDLTFKAPKSVSVLYAVSDDPRVQGAIIEAGEAALRDALGWLEREAIHVRRGSGDEVYLANLAAQDPDAAAAARIRSVCLPTASSPRRSGTAPAEPATRSCTGTPSSPTWPKVPTAAGRRSSTPTCTAQCAPPGEVFQTVLRSELTERLGVEWRPGRHVPEVAGVPAGTVRPVLEALPRDRRLARGHRHPRRPRRPPGKPSSPPRKGKPEVEHERFDTAWKTEADAAGWGPPKPPRPSSPPEALPVPVSHEQSTPA